MIAPLFRLACRTGAHLWAALLLSGLAHAADDIPWIWHSSSAPAQASEVAVLLDHLVLSGNDIQIRPRRRMLVVGKATRVTAVVHVQTDARHPPTLGPRQSQAIIAAMTAASRQSTSGWVQLDFEALQSQRTFYLALVAAVRRQIPPNTKLSVTVLASWCQQAGLLAKIEADEVVPMFFHMGAATDDYRARLLQNTERLDPRCRNQAAGFAVQEAPPRVVQQRYTRRYWFNFKNWDTD